MSKPAPKKRSRQACIEAASGAEFSRLIASPAGFAEHRYLTKKQVAAMLNLTVRTIELLMSKGLPHYKVGSRRTLFKLAELEDYLRTHYWVTRAA